MLGVTDKCYIEGDTLLAIEVQWDTVQEQCIVITYFSPWTWQEFDTAYATLTPMLDTAIDDLPGVRINIIFDIRKGGFPPPDALPHFKRVVETKYANVGQLIFVAPGALTHFVRISLAILKRVHRTVARSNIPEFQFVTSLEEARQLTEMVAESS